MDARVLLARMRALINNSPDLSAEAYAADPHPAMTWAAQAHALISRWRRSEVLGVQFAMDALGSQFTHTNNVEKIKGVLLRAISDLELEVPPDEQANFAAGEVYDFFARLNSIVASSEHSVFIVDPYLEPSVFHQYVAGIPEKVTVQLLTRRNIEGLREARDRFTQQYGREVELRQHHQVHDRVVFVDDMAAFGG